MVKTNKDDYLKTHTRDKSAYNETKNCVICGKEFASPLSRKKLYCSRYCYFKSREGHDVSEETRNKIAATKIGKPRPIEMVKKMAAKIKENYATGKIIHWQLGKHVSDERKVQQSKTMKQKYATGEIIHHQLGKPINEKSRLAFDRTGRVVGGQWYGNVKYNDNPYCEKWTAELRERVRAYFGYVCFECDTPQNHRKLNVHHIHYNKKTCCDGSPHDMVPLCPECHTKTNFNRDYWEDHLTELLYANNPDGKCFFTKEEMAAFKAS
jgi:ribosomal protein S14